MLLSKEVEVKLKGSKSIQHYISKGYEIPYKIDKNKRKVIDYSKNIIVKVEDLPKYSEVKVLVKCDYQEDGCRDEYYKNACDYIKNNIDNIVHTDCCTNRKCQFLKTIECNIINHGVKYTAQIPEVRQKTEQTNLNKYGSTNIFGSEYFKQNNKIMLNEKYGVDNVSQIDEIKNKKANTFYINGTIATSRQQRYLNKLFDGILNYSDNTPCLDIAFPDEKIYIEYNGSGHNLPVKSGRESQEFFDARERKRYYYLKDNGWKGIFINSEKDYLPSDEILISELNKAFQWLISDGRNHWHYVINIGNKVNDINYGKLRKIINEV